MITTLTDGYDTAYYPQTYANVVKRQFEEESVESSLARLEYFRSGIGDLNRGVVHQLIAFDSITKEMRYTEIEVLKNSKNIIELTFGNFFVDSSGVIKASSLNLTTIGNSKGKFLTLSNTGDVTYRTPNEVLEDIGGAPLVSPNFTGTPTAPTPTSQAEGNQVVNVDYVHAAVGDAVKQWGFIKLLSDNWSAEKDVYGYYTQRVDMVGMQEEFKPIFNLIVSSAALEAKEKEGFFGLGGIRMHNGYIVARTQTLPKVDIILDVKGV